MPRPAETPSPEACAETAPTVEAAIAGAPGSECDVLQRLTLMPPARAFHRRAASAAASGGSLNACPAPEFLSPVARFRGCEHDYSASLFYLRHARCMPEVLMLHTEGC